MALSTASVRNALFPAGPGLSGLSEQALSGCGQHHRSPHAGASPLARKLARESGLLYFQEGPEDYYEELLLKAMVLGYAKGSLADKAPPYRGLCAQNHQLGSLRLLFAAL